jgi:hypothetical protein
MLQARGEIQGGGITRQRPPRFRRETPRPGMRPVAQKRVRTQQFEIKQAGAGEWRADGVRLPKLLPPGVERCKVIVLWPESLAIGRRQDGEEGLDAGERPVLINPSRLIVTLGVETAECVSHLQLCVADSEWCRHAGGGQALLQEGTQGRRDLLRSKWGGTSQDTGPEHE